MKKYFLFVITLVLALLSLCSCGSSDQNAYAAWAALSNGSYLDYNSGYIAPDTNTDTSGEGKGTGSSDTETPDPTPSEPTYTDEEACDELFKLINQKRQTYSICQLERTTTLDAAAQYYAKTLDGEDSFFSKKDASITILKALSSQDNSIGNVIPVFIRGFSSPSDAINVLAEPVKYGDNVSRDSSLYDDGIQRIGIARYQGSDGVNYWAVLFVGDDSADK